MSCGNDPEAAAEEGEVLMPKRWRLTKLDQVCYRCKANRAQYLARSLAYCRECFLNSISHRFIRNLYPALRPTTAVPKAKAGKGQSISLQRPLVQSGQVVIALSGGAGSMAMLSHLMGSGFVGSGDGKRADLRKGEKEVIWDSGTVVYVEFCGLTGMGDRMEEMRNLAEEMGLGFVGVRAEEVYEGLEERLKVDIGPSGSQSSLEKLQTLLSSLSPASRPSFLQTILEHILTTVATSLLKVSHLLLGETSTREAQRVISGTALGRGWALPLELQPALPLHIARGDGIKQVVRVKPMKDISLKEAAIYCHLRRLTTTNERRFALGAVGGSRGKGATSLEMLTENFIAGLSVSHPSTVSTINKTGDKLVFAGNSRSGTICPVCQTPAEPSALEWKSRTSLISLGKIDHPTRSTITGQDDTLLHDPASTLCYACLTTLSRPKTAKADGEVAVLPPWVAQAQHLVTRSEMASQISEYLIGDAVDE